MNKDIKFEFLPDFQEQLLACTVQQKDGYKIISLYQDHYFTLLEHQLVAFVLKKYFKREKHVIQSETIFREELRQLYSKPEYSKSLNKKDYEQIDKVVKSIYNNLVKQSDKIMEAAVKFAQYIELRDTIENVNLKDFSEYDSFEKQVRKAITIGKNLKKNQGTYIIKDIADRQMERVADDNIFPSVFRQMDRMSNSGRGYNKHALITLLAPEKSFKTGSLVNIGYHLMRKRRKVLVIDLENGVSGYSLRFEQCIMNKPKKDILSSEYDEAVKKQLRKYRRIGAEVYIKRLPAYTTTCNDIQHIIDELKRDDGFVADDIIIDYIVLLGAISGTKDETQRISDAYVDVKNLLEKNNFISGYTAHHTNRNAAKRFETCFLTSDTAKCLDVARHVDIMIGLNQTPEEEENGVIRMEYMVQRDGPQHGKCLFWINKDHQRLREFSKPEIKEYFSQLGEDIEGKTKKSKKGGDIQ